MKARALFLVGLLMGMLSSWAQVPGNPVTTIETVTVCQDATTVDMPVTVSDFNDVGVINYKLVYSSSAISSPSVVYINPDLDLWGTFEANTAVADEITVGAYDPTTTTGISLSDDAILFTLRFTIGTITDETTISFYENIEGTSCELAGIDYEQTPFIDTPTETYYIAGGVDVIDFDPEAIAFDQTICEGENAGDIGGNNASGEGTFTYQWQSSITSATEGFSDIDGATLFYYEPGQVDVDTWFRREATATLLGTSCSAFSNVHMVTVINFDPGVIAGGGQMMCTGTDATAFTSTTEASGDGTITYQWQVSTTGESNGFSDITDETGSTYDPGTITVDTWYRRAASSLIDISSCTEYSNVLSVNVVTIDPGVIGSDQYIAEGAASTALTSDTDASGDGSVTYQWQMSTTSNSEGFSNIEGATNATYDPGTLTADAWYRRGATATLDVTSCSAFSNTIAVVVINLVPGSISDDQTGCEGEPVAPFASETDASGDGTVTYQWQSSTTSSTEGFNDISGANASTYDPGNASANAWFRREATASLGGTDITEYSNAVLVTVISLDPGSIDNEQTFCEGTDAEALSSVADATGDGTVTYQWFESTTSATEGFSEISGATAATFDPGAISVDTWFKREASTIVDVTECVKYSNVVKITANERKTISGYFYYYHQSGNIPMTGEDITVNLYKTVDEAHETLIASTVTDAAGHYEFTNLCPDCDYDIVGVSNSSTLGAINTTDAAQTNYWGAHPSTIELVKFYAGDVGNSGQSQDLSLNSTDAGRMQQNFVFGSPFDRKWTFYMVGTTISCNPACGAFPMVNLPVGSNATANMYALCTGDFNRSYNPLMTKSASTTLDLVQKGNLMVTSDREFNLPVRLLESSSIGAVSLILNFPADLVEVTSVTMNGAAGQLDWNVNGNELRIGWNSSTPIYLSDNSELLTLQLKTKPGFTSSTPVVITLANNPLNELADERYEVIGNAVLSIDAINGNALGVNEDPGVAKLSLGAYPNPFNSSSRLSYVLPSNGQVTLEITGILGVRTVAVDNEMQPEGYHEVGLNTNEFAPGIYIVTLRLKTDDDLKVRTIKLIKN